MRYNKAGPIRDDLCKSEKEDGFMTPQELVKRALEAQKYAYAPYSGFRVGAALLTAQGKVYTGCNIENKCHTPTVCAERTALFKAVSEGETEFLAIAVVGCTRDGVYKRFCTPCGVCRQALAEFCKPDFQIVFGDDSGDYEVHTLSELLPFAFDL